MGQLPLPYCGWVGGWVGGCLFDLLLEDREDPHVLPDGEGRGEGGWDESLLFVAVLVW